MRGRHSSELTEVGDCPLRRLVSVVGCGRERRKRLDLFNGLNARWMSTNLASIGGVSLPVFRQRELVPL
jgi:hypothetical protein